MVITFDLLNQHLIVSVVAILLIIVCSILGDSGKSTGWMFLLIPFIFTDLLLYWLFVFTNIWLTGGIIFGILLLSLIDHFKEKRKEKK